MLPSYRFGSYPVLIAGTNADTTLYFEIIDTGETITIENESDCGDENRLGQQSPFLTGAETTKQGAE